MPDYRLYYYESGALRKVARSNYKHTSMDSVRETIERMQSRQQIVLVEYTGQYDSRIIEVIKER